MDEIIPTNKSYIVTYVDFEEPANFYLRFNHALKQMNYGILYITERYSMKKYLLDHGVASKYIFFLQKDLLKDTDRMPDLHKSIEVLAGQFNLCQAHDLYTAAWNLLEQLPIDCLKYFFSWNGNKVIDQVFRDFAQTHHIKMLYFEIANIKGKLFVDPLGTNAKSLLYMDKRILDNFPVSQENYSKWRDNYIKEKFVQKTIPQAKKKSKVFAVSKIISDIWGFYFKNGVVQKHLSLNRIKPLAGQKNEYISQHDFDKNSYVFFPLQVSTDTQILINGRMGLIDAINYSLKKAEEWGKKLVIKPHPAEKSPACLDYIMKLVKDHKAEIADGNTFKLIENSYKTITINSTVGLEAKILQHPVEVIGKALYENFDEKDIERYIGGYLIDLDYFGNSEVTNETLEKILSRADLSVSRTGNCE